MITIYFPDGTFKRVTAVKGQQLVKAGKASYVRYINNIEDENVEDENVEDENVVTPSYAETETKIEPEDELSDEYESNDSDKFNGPEKNAYSFGD